LLRSAAGGRAAGRLHQTISGSGWLYLRITGTACVVGKGIQWSLLTIIFMAIAKTRLHTLSAVELMALINNEWLYQ